MGWKEGFLQDLRYAFRTMRRDAAFCAIAVLILGLGIGANTAIFSVVNTVLLRPLPFYASDRLVWIANTGTTGLSGATSRVSNYRDWRAMNQSFEDISSYFAFSDYNSYNLTGSGDPERLSGYGVAQNFFPLLGVQPALGRNFDAEESKFNGRKAAILTYGLWERRFGSDPSIVGRNVMTQRPVGDVVLRDADGERAIAVDHENLYERGVAAFCAAMRGEGRPAATGEDGIRSLNAALAVVEACRVGAAIRIVDPVRGLKS